MDQCNRNKPKLGLPVRASCTADKTEEQDNFFFQYLLIILGKKITLLL